MRVIYDSAQPPKPPGRKFNFNRNILVILLVIMASAYLFTHRPITPANPSSTLIEQPSLTPQKPRPALDIPTAIRASYSGSDFKIIKELDKDGTIRKALFEYSSSEIQIFGLIVMPDKPAAPGGYKTIIYCHDYVRPDTYNPELTPHMEDMMQLANAGYAVLMPDLRGHGKSSGIAEGAYYTPAYTTDVLNLIDAAGKSGQFNISSVATVGHGMGGYISLRAAIISQNIKATVIYSGTVGSVKSMFQDWATPQDLDNSEAQLLKSKVISRQGDFTSNPAYWQSVSPLHYVTRLSGPVQIHVNKSDPVVPSQFSAELNQALSMAGVRHEYFVYNGTGHNLVANRSFVIERTLDLLSTALPKN